MNMEKDNDNGIMTVLDAMERIMETGRGSGLSEEFFRNADTWIKVVSQRLALTPVQSVLLSAFMNSSADNSIRVSDFADYFGCSTLRIIKYMKDIDVLEERKYIRCSSSRDHRTYRVPMEVVDAHPGCRVVFLGDYLDPYGYVHRGKLLDNLRAIMQLKRDRPEDVVLLLGNHDLHYFCEDACIGTRFDEEIAEAASCMFLHNIDLFQYAFQDGEYLFTHAGVSQEWFECDFCGDA